MCNRCKVVDVRVYELIIKGKLRPTLQMYSRVENLDRLIRLSQRIHVATFPKTASIQRQIKQIDISAFGFIEPEHATVIQERNENDEIEIYLEPEKTYEGFSDYGVPRVTSMKSTVFCELIIDEFERIKIRGGKFIELAKKESQVDFYAIKNLHKSQQLLEAAKRILTDLSKKEDRENLFIYYILGDFLIRTIDFFSQMSAKACKKLKKTTEMMDYELIIASIGGKIKDFFKQTLTFFDKSSNFPRPVNKGNQDASISKSVDIVDVGNSITLEMLEKFIGFATWHGPVNVLGDALNQMLYPKDPAKSGYLEAEVKELAKFISVFVVNSFKEHLKASYLEGLLRPGNPTRKLKSDSEKRIIIDFSRKKSFPK